MTGSRPAALDFLLSRSAGTVPHRKGTFLEHLLATEARLRAWGSSEELCRAGLLLAAYGTDGFSPHLLPVTDRAVLAAAVGAEVEQTIYLYASCDRAFLYPQLSSPGPVRFRDRFTDVTFVPSPARLRALEDLTLANELDVALGHHPSPRRCEPPSWIGPLVDQMLDRASPGARRGVGRRLDHTTVRP
jgi:hypothetical protein